MKTKTSMKISLIILSSFLLIIILLPIHLPYFIRYSSLSLSLTLSVIIPFSAIYSSSAKVRLTSVIGVKKDSRVRVSVVLTFRGKGRLISKESVVLTSTCATITYTNLRSREFFNTVDNSGDRHITFQRSGSFAIVTRLLTPFEKLSIFAAVFNVIYIWPPGFIAV